MIARYLSSALFTLVILAPIAAAGEPSEFHARGVLVTTSYSEIDMPDDVGGVLMHAEEDGVIFDEGGAAFLENARYQVYWLADPTSNGTIKGYKVFTLSDEARIFGQFEGKAGNPTRGSWSLTGGTGSYAGVKGEGSFEFHSIGEGVGYDLLEGTVELPEQAAAAQ